MFHIFLALIFLIKLSAKPIFSALKAKIFDDNGIIIKVKAIENNKIKLIIAKK